MRQLRRLLRYVVPYWWQLLSSILLMAAVGLLDAFRVLLIGPIFDRVLNPGSPEREMQLFKVPFTGNTVYLQQFVPSHFRNPWTVVAFALVAATILKGIFDYAGTYLVNYAGFGMITDLRNQLYNSILRRSSAFFQQHTTGTLLSTIVNDIERVQFAMSSVLSEFLQQFFTLIFTAFVVVLLGGKTGLGAASVCSLHHFLGGHIGQRVRQTTRKGQDKLADIQNILHETISGNRIVKAFSMESWEIARFRQSGATPVPRQPALRGRSGHQFSADGHLRRHCHCLAPAARARADQPPRLHRRHVPGFHHRGVQALRPGSQVCPLQ